MVQGADSIVRDNDWWHLSAHTEGRDLILEYHFKRPADPKTFSNTLAIFRKQMVQLECDDQSANLKRLNATQSYVFYAMDGQRLTSFSMTPADCPR
jgi:hypothetical protein